MSKLATHLKHSPEHATSEQLRQFQIALVAEGASSGTINATIMLGAFASQVAEYAAVAKNKNQYSRKFRGHVFLAFFI